MKYWISKVISITWWQKITCVLGAVIAVAGAIVALKGPSAVDANVGTDDPMWDVPGWYDEHPEWIGKW